VIVASTHVRLGWLAIAAPFDGEARARGGGGSVRSQFQTCASSDSLRRQPHSENPTYRDLVGHDAKRLRTESSRKALHRLAPKQRALLGFEDTGYLNMSINVDEKFMQLAIAEAKRAKQEGDLPFGAIVICDGQVVGKGRAQDNITQDVAAHAELQAVREACKRFGSKELANCVIYCTNEPCMMCAAAIFQADIPRVIIGASREDIPHILRSRKLRIDHLAGDSHHKIEIIRGVLRDEVLELFKGVKRK